MKMKKKKIAVVTGARAEYGLLKPVMEKIKQHPRLRLLTIVTGSHLDKTSGLTVKEIQADGFKIDARVPMYADFGAENLRIPLSLSRGFSGLTRALAKLKPDILLILGDRGEVLMAAIAAAYLNIPIAHIHGGDQCAGADIDDNIRHAVTKLAHLHFAASKKSARRLKSLSEESWRVHLTGAPGLDSILRRPLPGAKDVARRLKLDLKKPVVLLLQHAVSSETKAAGRQMAITLKALAELNLPTVAVYPNADPGNLAIIKELEKYRGRPFLRLEKSLAHDVFLGLMKIATVMVGNSSSAIVEAPSFKLPAVNIGIRQTDRETGDNIINAGHDEDAIKRAVRKAINDEVFRKKLSRSKSPYGDGRAAERIVKILAETPVDEKLLRKKFVLPKA